MALVNANLQVGHLGYAFGSSGVEGYRPGDGAIQLWAVL
jgi:hypothetical protein